MGATNSCWRRFPGEEVWRWRAFSLVGPLWLFGLSLLAASLPSCAGRGSGGAGEGIGQVIALGTGRGVIAPSGPMVVSPLTYATLDRETGLALPETVRPIGPGVNAEALLRFALGRDFHAPIVPRNGFLVLEFSSALDAASVRADEVGPHGEVLREGSVQVRRLDGRGIPVSLIVDGTRLLVNPLSDERTGFPASPLVYDADGLPTTYPEGAARISFPKEKAKRPRMLGGEPLHARKDGWGEESRPIGFSPGNRLLDFIARNSIYPLEERFNGYLPDDRPPRLVREHLFSGVLDAAQGDRAGAWSLTDIGANFNAVARGGRGEWAGALLTIRPGSKREETVTVDWHTTDHLTLAQPLEDMPQDGESYRLSRIEYFEPDPRDPIDADLFDPFNPENDANTELSNFVTAREIDEHGEPFGPPLDLGAAIPARVEVSLLFSEPMDEANLLAFENLVVTSLRPESGERDFVPGQLLLSEHAQRVTFRPVLRDAGGEVVEVHGLAPDPGSYWLDLTTVPADAFLVSRYSNDVVERIRDEGYRALTDLGGNPLAFPASMFESDMDRIVYRARIESLGLKDAGEARALAHVFRGMPEGRFDPETNEFLGVEYRDRAFSYGPALADINLQAPGVLSGAAMRFFQKVFDEENPSRDGLIERNGTFPFGAATPLGGFQFTDGLAYSGIFGARFQHLYRNQDISPAPGAGSVELSLWRLSWAPAGGFVWEPPDVYEDISIHVAHSEKRPTDSPSFYDSLDQAFDPEYYEVCCFSWENTACDNTPSFHTKGPNYQPPLITTVDRGTAYVPSNTGLFVPETTTRQYLAWPVFDHLFPYDNEHSLLIEYRIRPQATLISFLNSFTFSLAFLNRSDPLFRAYSLGSYTNPMDPDDMTDPRVQCAEGPQVGKPHYGDNAVYYMAFDWVKAVSNIESSFGDSLASPGRSIEWHAPIIVPPLAELPYGTFTRLEFQGAYDLDGSGATEWVDDLQQLEGYPVARFRVRFEGHVASRSVPCLDMVALPFVLRERDA
ncbi:MAG: hypothetical protein AB1486_16375 [Planctomycetota bacterium]